MANIIISRTDALSQGLKRYFTGKPCKHGHLAERWASMGACVECTRLSSNAPHVRGPINEKRMADRRAAREARGPKPRSAAKAAGLTRYSTGKPCSRGHVAERLVATRQCVECLKGHQAEYREKYWEKRSEYRVAYYKKNAEKEREHQRAVRSTEEGKAKANAATAKWREQNPDVVKEYQGAYVEANRDRLRQHRMNRWRNPEVREHLRALAAAQRKKHREKLNAKNRENYEKNKEQRREYARAHKAKNREAYAARQRNRIARQRAAEGTHTAEDIKRIYKAQKGKCACCKKVVGSKYQVDHIQPLARGGSNWPANLQILCPPCNNKKHVTDWIVFMQRRGFLL